MNASSLLALLAVGQKVDQVGSDNNLTANIIGIINAIIAVLGIICVIVVLIGGITYMTSSGDPSKTKKGKDTILYGVIGLIICVLSFAIVNFVIGNILGQSGGGGGGQPVSNNTVPSNTQKQP